MSYRPGDRVCYIGTRLSSLLKEKGVKRGEIVARVRNVEDEYVVEFGDDAYVLKEDQITRWVPSQQELRETEAMEVVRRRKRDEDD